MTDLVKEARALRRRTPAESVRYLAEQLLQGAPPEGVALALQVLVQEWERAEAADRIGSNREFLRLSDAAAILGISTRQAYRWAERGRLPTVDLGGARGRFVPARALYAFLASTAVVSLNGTASADEEGEDE